MNASPTPTPVAQANETTIRLIASAMILGLLLFAALTLFLAKGLLHPPTFSALQKASILMSVLSVPLSFVLPGIVQRPSLEKVKASGANPADPALRPALLGIYQVGMLVGYALLEGPALLGLMVVLIEKNQSGLFTAATSVLLMVFRFPSAGRIQEWMDGAARAWTS